mgnify:CR=1 FL=1
MLIPTAQALEIVREVTGGNPDRTLLKRWADQGRIDRVAVHARCGLYHDDQIRSVALTAKDGKKHHSTMGAFSGVEISQ